MGTRRASVLSALGALGVLAFFAAASAIRAEPLVSTYSIQSKVLGEERHIRVFLPPSYGELDHSRYPALYMVDGDYHFLYLSGLLEQMSSISEQIPETILIAIDDHGKSSYLHDMAPTLESEDGEEPGGASRFMEFVETELIPFVEGKLRVSDYRVLAGQSMGGLFTVATLLEKPGLFDAFIAISPSLWWHDQALVAEAERVFEANQDLASRLHLTVADERGMGVLGFADLLDRAAPPGLTWDFERHLDENHGSVGLPSMRTALRQEFEGFVLSREEFYALDGPEAVVGHWTKLRDKRGDFLLPPRVVSDVLHFYQRKNLAAELERFEDTVAAEFPTSLPVVRMARAASYLEAEAWQSAYDLYRKVVADEPNAFNAWSGIALAAAHLDRADEARKAIEHALELAPSRGARVWQINQLQADRRQVLELVEK